MSIRPVTTQPTPIVDPAQRLSLPEATRLAAHDISKKTKNLKTNVPLKGPLEEHGGTSISKKVHAVGVGEVTMKVAYPGDMSIFERQHFDSVMREGFGMPAVKTVGYRMVPLDNEGNFVKVHLRQRIGGPEKIPLDVSSWTKREQESALQETIWSWFEGDQDRKPEQFEIIQLKDGTKMLVLKDGDNAHPIQDQQLGIDTKLDRHTGMQGNFPTVWTLFGRAAVRGQTVADLGVMDRFAAHLAKGVDEEIIVKALKPYLRRKYSAQLTAISNPKDRKAARAELRKDAVKNVQKRLKRMPEVAREQRLNLMREMYHRQDGDLPMLQRMNDGWRDALTLAGADLQASALMDKYQEGVQALKGFRVKVPVYDEKGKQVGTMRARKVLKNLDAMAADGGEPLP